MQICLILQGTKLYTQYLYISGDVLFFIILFELVTIYIIRTKLNDHIIFNLTFFSKSDN